MNRIFPVILLSIFFLLQPNKLHAQLGQCPTCKKAIANCPYEGKHPVPQKTVSFFSSDPCHPMLLFIDGDRKDSITAYWRFLFLRFEVWHSLYCGYSSGYGRLQGNHYC